MCAFPARYWRFRLDLKVYNVGAVNDERKAVVGQGESTSTFGRDVQAVKMLAAGRNRAGGPAQLPHRDLSLGGYAKLRV